MSTIKNPLTIERSGEIIRGMTKMCKVCGTEKPLDEFHRDPGRKDGRKGVCASCARRQKRERYQARKAAFAALEKQKAS